MAKKDSPFNNPFSSLKLKKDEPKKPAAPPAPPKQKPLKQRELDAESAMFLEAMGEVAPVRSGPKLAEPERPKLDVQKVRDDEAESLIRLAEMVVGDGPIQLRGSEGALVGLDEGVMGLLRAGKIAAGATLERKAPAQADVERFLQNARTDGHRCVVLSGPLELRWLTQGRLARQVMAAVTGADGSVRVLLRR